MVSHLQRRAISWALGEAEEDDDEEDEEEDEEEEDEDEDEVVAAAKSPAEFRLEKGIRE